jgi:branched-chain amino acid transport system ATP-binding protein
VSLEVAGLNVRYGKSHVVFDLGLRVDEGEVLTLLGRNGAGKTTTILGILGLLPDTRGSVVVDGRNLSRWPAHRRTRGHLAYVPSGARCFPNLTVAENLQLTAYRDGVRGWDLARVYQTFPRLEVLRANLAGGLSGGERQMLAVGRALMGNPRVMLLDEPTEGLAPVIVQSIATLLQELKTTGVAILLAEQNHQVALRVADRAAFLEKGRVVEELPSDRARNSEVLHRILGI